MPFIWEVFFPESEG